MNDEMILQVYVANAGQAFGFFQELANVELVDQNEPLEPLNDFLKVMQDLQITFNIYSFKGEINAMNTLYQEKDYEIIKKTIDNLK